MSRLSDMPQPTYQPSLFRMQVDRVIDRFGSFMLALFATFSLMMNVVFIESFSNARLGAVLILLLFIHLLRYPSFVFNREFAAYALFVAYMLFQLLWTHDIRLAMNTLIPAIAFILVLVLFGSILMYHNRSAVFSGMLCGVLIGAGFYTVTFGFPFVRPEEFSYNAIAGMYLFGLLVCLLLVCNGHLKQVTSIFGVIFLLLIVATTSIKTNLGILFGVAGVAVMYFKQFINVIGKNVIPIIVLAGLLGYSIVSSDALMQRVQSGYDRVVLGVEILEARENLPGYSGLDNRRQWIQDGLAGWKENPVFGHGVEAFRSRYDVTSHATPVDLLYNSGLIGFSLFYYIFISLIWRLVTDRGDSNKYVDAFILGTIICYLFITLSGTMHYSTFLAAFLAVASVFLSRGTEQRSPASPKTPFLAKST